MNNRTEKEIMEEQERQYENYNDLTFSNEYGDALYKDLSNTREDVMYSRIHLDHAPYFDAWYEVEDKFGIKFINKSCSFRPVDEVLDDIYLQEPSNLVEMLEYIFSNGDKLFSHLTRKRDR